MVFITFLFLVACLLWIATINVKMKVVTSKFWTTNGNVKVVPNSVIGYRKHGLALRRCVTENTFNKYVKVEPVTNRNIKQRDVLNN